MAGEDVFDITIIGAGPTGLFAAFYAGLREMRTKIVEALPEPGGQLAVLYPEKLIYDVPGHPKILAQDLVRLLDRAVRALPAGVRLRHAHRDADPRDRRRRGGVAPGHGDRDALLAHDRHLGRHRRVPADEDRQARRRRVRGPRRLLLREGQAPVPRQADTHRRRRRHRRGLVPQPQGLGEGDHADPSPRPVPRARVEPRRTGEDRHPHHDVPRDQARLRRRRDPRRERVRQPHRRRAGPARSMRCS